LIPVERTSALALIQYKAMTNGFMKDSNWLTGCLQYFSFPQIGSKTRFPVVRLALKDFGFE
jgi:hypothetical protein